MLHSSKIFGFLYGVMSCVWKIHFFWVVTLSSRVIHFWCFEGRSKSPRRIFTGPLDLEDCALH
jgi:uncharacterized membrane protein YecN with MAPEG domain